METIIQKDPDAILVLQPGFRSGDGQGPGKGRGTGANSNGPGQATNQSQNTGAAKSISPEELLAIYQNDPMWKQLSAVKNGKLIIVPANIAPGKITGLEDLNVTAQLIAPEAFE